MFTKWIFLVISTLARIKDFSDYLVHITKFISYRYFNVWFLSAKHLALKPILDQWSMGWEPKKRTERFERVTTIGRLEYI